MRSIRKKDIVLAVFVVLIILITESGNGFFSLRRTECIYVAGILVVFWGIAIYKRVTEIKYLLPITYLLLTLWNTKSFDNTFAYLLIYVSGTLLIFGRMINEKMVNALMNAFKWIGIANAVVIVLSPVVPRLVATAVGIIYYPPSPAGSITKALNSINRGIYYGFCGEKSIAAFIMAVALIVYICEYFYYGGLSRGKWGVTIILLIALMMTGKRMEFLVPIICFLAFFLLIRRRGKGIKFFGILLVGAVAMYLLPLFVPQAALVLNRFQNSGADTFVTGREILWEYAVEMFKNNKLLGTGYGSYNSIINTTGFVSPTGEAVWGYHAHSIYYQMLGECGIIGCICWGITYLWSMIKGLWNIYRPALKTIPLELLFSVGMLMMILIYGLSGNTLYETSQLYTSFIALAIYRRYEIEYCFSANGEMDI